MKLSGYIQFPVSFCMGIFLISGLELKTGNWSFPEEPTIVPCNIFLRFLFFRFELPTGNWNDDLALVQGQLYTTPKFHSNPSYSPWGEEGSTLKNGFMIWIQWLSKRFTDHAIKILIIQILGHLELVTLTKSVLCFDLRPSNEAISVVLILIMPKVAALLVLTAPF